jgi:hypothetical protein
MDKLDEELEAILREADLPHCQGAVERVREDIDIAKDRAADTAALKLPKGEAIALVNAARQILTRFRSAGSRSFPF